MRVKSLSLLLAPMLAILTLAAPAVSQEGHPMEGTWYGEYGSGGRRQDLTIVFDWSGQQLSGVVHPGPDAIQVRNIVIDITPGEPAPEGTSSVFGKPPVFEIRFEAMLPGRDGAATNHVFEGTLVNPVPGNRRLEGTWTAGAESGAFRIQRL